ncbi:F-box protein CPR1-like [Salvia hispanica]|uniref:F-box protein CPR1-like n=1 Tax=Salvia hispanica TaxID=49212 RepID=UPI002009037B|nr:F-box protein CPR1-like [Salvia hispanica]
MGEDLFKYLPSEIVVNILSRLPTRAAMACKCVCKPWLGLLATPEFVNSHISRSLPGLAVETQSKSFEVIEFVDELGFDFDEDNYGGVDFNFKFELPFDEPIHSSANGLIFLRDYNRGDLILCNPVTRDYIKLPSPRQTTSGDQHGVESFGFGVSRTSDQYKVVRIFIKAPVLREDYQKIPPPMPQYECQVYTVGTGTWRRVPSGSPRRFFSEFGGLLFNGNLHWMVIEIISDHLVQLVEQICCFDLETELFSSFTLPPRTPSLLLVMGLHYRKEPSVLRDCLCVSHFAEDGGFVIRSMKEYGDEKSWTKEVLTREVCGEFSRSCPIRIFENGDILIECDRKRLFYYSNKTKAGYDLFFREDQEEHISTTMHAPSFLSLENFAVENVSSF